MGFEITILGSSSATPTPDRHPSAQYFSFNGRQFLLDCGEGTQIQIMRLGLKFFKIEKIFISHLHPDHFLGLPGLLSTLSLNGRTTEIDIYSPAGLQEILETLFEKSGSFLTFPLRFHVLGSKTRKTIFEDKSLKVSSFSLNHRVACYGFLFEEKKALRKIIKEEVQDLGLPHFAYDTLRAGKDYVDENGKVFSFEKLTSEAPVPSSYAYITDTIFLPKLARQLKGTRAIYHEATFSHELQEKAVQTMHSTAREAAEFGKIAGAEKVLIGHFSSRYKDLSPLLAEAKAIFTETFLATEGGKFRI